MKNKFFIIFTTTSPANSLFEYATEPIIIPNHENGTMNQQKQKSDLAKANWTRSLKRHKCDKTYIEPSSFGPSLFGRNKGRTVIFFAKDTVYQVNTIISLPFLKICIIFSYRRKLVIIPGQRGWNVRLQIRGGSTVQSQQFTSWAVGFQAGRIDSSRTQLEFRSNFCNEVMIQLILMTFFLEKQ